jgi:hypothetical protein
MKNRIVEVTVMLLLVITAIIPGTSAIAGSVDKTKLIQALIRVESRGNDNAIGDRHMKHKAYGPLQIRKPCVDDVNRRYGTKIEAKNLLGDRAKSEWVCQKYLEMYATQKRLGKEPTYEDMARMWNGGPNGWKQSSTLKYWSKVKKELAK